MKRSAKQGLSRRELAAAAAGSAFAMKAAAQAPAPPPTAREANERNAETLAKFELPAATEPAFQFKA